MNIFELAAKISVNRSQAEADIKAVESTGKKAASSMGTGFQEFGDDLAKWVKRGAVVAVAAVTALGVSSIKTYTDIQKGMAEVFTLMPGLSAKAKDAMMADMQALSKEVGILPTETIPALYQAISAGVPADNVFTFLEVAAKAAKGGVASLEESVDVLTSVTNAYGRDVMSVEKAADLLFTTVRLGKTTFSELSSYLFQVAPVAAAVGVSFDQVAAGMAEITTKGVATRIAATQLRSMLNELSSSGSQAADIFEELAGKTFVDFIDSGNDLADVLELMRDYADANGITLKDLFGNLEGGMAALNLAGNGVDGLRIKLDEMANSTRALDDAYAEMAATIQDRLDKLAAWWQTVKFNIGEELQAGLAGLLDWLEANQERIESGLIATFKTAIDAFQWLVDHGGMVKAALMLIAAGLFAILAVTNPVTAGILAVTAGVIGLMVAHTNAVDAQKAYAQALRDAEIRQQDYATAVDDTAEALAGLREEEERLSVAIEEGTSQAAENLTRNWDAALSLTEAYEYLVDQLNAFVEAGKLTAGQADAIYNDLTAAIKLALAAETIEEGRRIFLGYVQTIKDAYGVEIPAALKITTTGLEELDDAHKVIIPTIEELGEEEMRRAELHVAMMEEEARKLAALGKAYEDVAAAINKPTEFESFFLKIGTAVDGLTNRLPAAEQVLLKYGSSVDELKQKAAGLAKAAGLKEASDEYKTFVDDYVEQNSALVENAVETRDGILEAWESLTDDLGGAYNDFLTDLGSMIAENKQLAQEHADTLTQIEKDNTETLKTLSDQRLKDQQETLASLNEGTIASQEYATRMREIDEEYTAALLAQNAARQTALDEEKAAYEEQKRSVWDILKEMVRNVLVAVREELALRAAKEVALAIVDVLTLNPVGAAGHFAAAAGLGLAAAGLAISGFAKGGIATVPTLGAIAEAGTAEGVIPLDKATLSAIGRAIAAASGMSREPLSAAGIPGLSGGVVEPSVSLGSVGYDGAAIAGALSAQGGDVTSVGDTEVNVTFERVEVRQDSDIDAIAEAIEKVFRKNRRGRGLTEAFA